ncbi:MAG: hypothetical protein GC185_01110 [Alphaproteobacteria bacterium]|nr:hypothetical protein [Alphaproteobacteria bacterium]
MPENNQPSCWVVTEALAGLQSQATGLAAALGLVAEVKSLAKPGAPWKFLPSGFWPSSLALSLCTDDGGLAPPWPDVLITCGRCSVAVALAIRKASGGRTFTVHIQDPHMGGENFDAVIVAAHDALRGPNVLATQGALHRVTREKLAAGHAQFADYFSGLPRPLFSVLVGGGLKGRGIGAQEMRGFAQKLHGLAVASGGALAVTPSRRTGPEIVAALEGALSGVPHRIWDGQGENPYLGMLAHADAIVVTSDSVSMTSEACFTGKPVYVHDFGLRSKRLCRFQAALMEKGVTRALTGAPQDWTPPAMDDMALAVEFLRPRLDVHFKAFSPRCAC